MTLAAIVLGSGTSSGVPRIGNDWGRCDPANPKNRRTRVSIIVESPTTRILVDTSPDLREQLLASQISDVDAVLWTHDHADHSHGIDDLRVVMQLRRSPIAGFARRPTMTKLKSRFDYVFAGGDGYRPIVEGEDLPEELTIGDIAIRWTDQPHGSIFSTGFRFDHDGKSVAYATDFHVVTPEMLALYSGVDLLIIDALRERPHPTHPHLAMVLEALEIIRPGRAILTHMDNSMDYAHLFATLPPQVEPGFDGQRIML